MHKKLAAYSAQIVAAAYLLSGRAVAAECSNTNNPLRDGVFCTSPDGSAPTLEVVFRNVANTLTFLVGAVAVIMLIVGGLRYVMSAGNKDAVESAKNTILYALIGVVVAIMAFAAVSFVVNRFS